MMSFRKIAMSALATFVVPGLAAASILTLENQLVYKAEYVPSNSTNPAIKDILIKNPAGVVVARFVPGAGTRSWAVYDGADGSARKMLGRVSGSDIVVAPDTVVGRCEGTDPAAQKIFSMPGKVEIGFIQQRSYISDKMGGTRLAKDNGLAPCPAAVLWFFKDKFAIP